MVVVAGFQRNIGGKGLYDRRQSFIKVCAVVSAGLPSVVALNRCVRSIVRMQVVEQALDILELRQIAGSRLLHGRDGGGVGNERSER